MFRNRILALTLHIKTKKKVVAVKDNSVPVFDDSLLEYHTLRFESYSSNWDWVLTDVDHILDGNDYYTH